MFADARSACIYTRASISDVCSGFKDYLILFLDNNSIRLAKLAERGIFYSQQEIHILIFSKHFILVMVMSE